MHVDFACDSLQQLRGDLQQRSCSAAPEPSGDAAALTDNCCYGVTVPRKYDAALEYFFFFQPKTHFFSLTGQHQLQKQKSSVCWNSLKAPDNSYKRDPIVPHPPYGHSAQNIPEIGIIRVGNGAVEK